MKTLTAIQDEYIETINIGIERWAHRKNGGHASRIARGACAAAEKQLRKAGFTDQKQIDAIINDARDMARLERESKS